MGGRNVYARKKDIYYQIVFIDMILSEERKLIKFGVHHEKKISFKMYTYLGSNSVSAEKR